MAQANKNMPRTTSSQAMLSLVSAYDVDDRSDSEDEGETVPTPTALSQESDQSQQSIQSQETTPKDPTPPAAVTNVTTEVERRDSNPFIDDRFSGDEDQMSPLPQIVEAPVIAHSSYSPGPFRTAPLKSPKGLAKLVSYGMDNIDDEDEDEDATMEDMEIDPQVGDPEWRNKVLVDYDINGKRITQDGYEPQAKKSKDEPFLLLANGERVELPPAATGKPTKALQAKISEYHAKCRTGLDLSHSIERRKDFRNPSIYEKLIHYCNLDEKGTNYPPHLFDLSIWGPESFYDSLSKAQKEDMDKREKDKKEKTKVEFVTATKKVDHMSGSAASAARRSKWDAQMPRGSTKPVGIATNLTISTSVTSAPTGTKSTVIPASGVLKRK